MILKVKNEQECLRIVRKYNMDYHPHKYNYSLSKEMIKKTSKYVNVVPWHYISRGSRALRFKDHSIPSNSWLPELFEDSDEKIAELVKFKLKSI